MIFSYRYYCIYYFAVLLILLWTSSSSSLLQQHTIKQLPLILTDHTTRRRQLLLQPAVSWLALISSVSPTPARAAGPLQNNNNNNNNNNNTEFFTSAFNKQEYTNSIIVSRDTNISPSEVYDSISSSYLQYPLLQARQLSRIPRAWDVGCGAGVSTQVLWNMGYRDIVALDWSSTAWMTHVVEQGSCPSSVTFYPMDDEQFVLKQEQQQPLEFDAVVFNFAINESKALRYARQLLSKSGRLLAPVNVQSDYWLKQEYRVYDSEGEVLWKAMDVGAWSVLFQPDVTQDTCQGIWCSPYNGFQKQTKPP